MFNVDTVDIVMLGALVPLLILSGFFSSSETVLFGLSESDRMQLRRRGSLAAGAVDQLLSEPRMLLITVLLGNMTINTIYFVVSSVLTTRIAGSALAAALFAVATLLLIVLFGEVLPKLVGNAARMVVAGVVAPPLLALHRALTPFRSVIDRGVVAPLSRLTAPADAPPTLDEDELGALVELSGRQGVLDNAEQELLREVVRLRRLKVRDVMTPRVAMLCVATHATRAEFMRVAGRRHITQMLVHDGDADRIAGIVNVRAYLLDARCEAAPMSEYIAPVRFIPEVASLEQLLRHFRETGSKIAIAVDEYGGTAGIVTLEDVVEEIVGDIVGFGEEPIPEPERLPDGGWRVSGRMHVDDWAEAFGSRLAETRVRTVTGLFLEQLGHIPTLGESIRFGNVVCTAEELDGARVRWAVVRLRRDEIRAAEREDDE